MIPGIVASVRAGTAPSTLQFHAALLSSAILEVGTATPVFTRATAATVNDWERVADVPSGGIRFRGGRSAYNLAASTDSPATQNITVVSGNVYQVRIGAASASGSTAVLSNAATGTLTGDATDPQSFDTAKTASTTTLTITITGSVTDLQVEDVTGQSNQNPSEYVSVGTLSSPFHGAGIDGYKWFETENGNTVTSNVVTEATGAALTGLGAYLNEEQRTNLCLRSEEFGNSPWAKSKSGDTVAVDVQASPSGETTGDSFTADGALGLHGLFQIGPSEPSVTQTLSCYIKNSTADYIFITAYSSAANNFYSQVFDLTDGSIGQTMVGTSSGQVDSSSITDEGNGWFRISMTGSYTGVANDVISVGIAGAKTGNPYESFGRHSITSSGVFYMWGYQVETGTFLTSYIHTVASTQTRNADALTYDYQPPALLGSMLMTTIPLAAANDAVALGNSTGSLWQTGDPRESDDGTNQVVYGNPTALIEAKYGLTWDDGAGTEVATYKDGSQVNTGSLDAGGFASGTDFLGIGCRGSDGTLQQSGTYSDVKFYTEAKDQTFMEAATT